MKTEKHSDDSKFATILTLVVAFSPMFLQYSLFLPFILLPEFCFLLLIAFSFFAANRFNRWYLCITFLLFFYLLLISYYRYLTEDYVNIALSVTTSGRLFFYFLFVIVLSSYFKRDLAAKVIIYIGLLNSIYGLSQFVSFNFFGITLPWYLPYLNVEHGKKLITDQDYIFEAFGFRFSGLFSEPAHFSQFVGFSFLVMLFYPNRELFNHLQMILFSILFSLALLLSASGTGFFIIMFLISSVSYRYIFCRFSFKRMLIGISGFIMFFSTFLFALFTNDIFSFGISRITSFEDSSSLYVRMIRPLIVFYELDLFQKIFGVGYGNYSTYMENYGLFNSYERYLGFAWTNSLGVFLVGSGLIGTFIVALFYLLLYLKTDIFGKLVVVFLLFHFLFSDLPHSIFFVCFIFFVVSSRNLFNQYISRFIR